MKWTALVFFLMSCGRAQFAADTDPSPPAAIAVIASATDYYFEIGESFSDQVVGDVTLSNVQVFGSSTWPGISSLTFEMRLGLTGTAAPGMLVVTPTQPISWANASPIFNLTLPAHSVNDQLVSANIKDDATKVLAQGRFWIVGRLRYTGLDLTNTLLLTNLIVHAEGEKSFSSTAPLLNFGF